MDLDIILCIIIAILVIYLYKTNQDDIMKLENTTELSMLILGGFLLVYISVHLHQWLGMNYSVAMIGLTYLVISIILLMYYFGYKDNEWGKTTTAFTIGQLVGLLVSTNFDPVSRFGVATIVILYTMFSSSLIGGIKSVFEYLNDGMTNITYVSSDVLNTQMNDIINELNF
jgi:hypothetical protein